MWKLAKGCLAAGLMWMAAGAQAQEPIRLGMIDGLSGPFANAGDAVVRNLRIAIERVNARGGVNTAQGKRPMELVTFDSKGNVDESLIQFRSLVDKGIPFVLQGNSSAVASALVAAINRHNARQPDARVLFLNYSAVDPSLTNENCSFWHFRFDASADMRMQALAEVIRQDHSVHRVYLVNQDYSFGHQVSRSARDMLAAKRPDVQFVGDEFHPIGKIKDFAPYIAKIKASGADAVVTGKLGQRPHADGQARAKPACRQSSTPSMAMAWARRPRWAMPAWAACWPWRSGTRMSAAQRRTPSTSSSARATPSRRTTTCTCACR